MSKPAARIGDMHVCPMVTPGVPPIPHVGGPIMGPGVPTVLIGNMPAAVMGDMCTCVGPPDSVILGSTGVLIGGKPAARMGDMTAHGGTIVLGCPTVLIGEISPGTVVTKQSLTVLEQFKPEASGVAQQVVAMQQAADAGKPFCEVCAKNTQDEPPPEEQFDESGEPKEEAPKEEEEGGWLDGFQTGLDLIGLVPGLGEVADGINGLISLGRGNHADAALSFAAMLPIGGQAATAAKFGKKGVEAVKKARVGKRKISQETYDHLRKKTPNKKLRNMVNKGKKPPYDDPVLPGRKVTGRLQADHVVSMDKITKMDGFDKLTEAQQLEVLNNPKNFIGLSESANKSKKAKTFAEWTEHKASGTKVSEEFRQEMMEKEIELEGVLQEQIDNLLKGN